MRPLPFGDDLEAAARLWVGFTPAEFQRFAGAFRSAEFPARGAVAVPGRGDHAVFFVARGLVRFYTLEEDTEATQHFGDAGTFVRAVAALAQGRPYGAQALEPSTVLTVSAPEWERLLLEPVFDRFGRRLAEAMLLLKEQRLRGLQLLHAADRYADFVRRFPSLVDRVPQYHIASYLGITPVTLSRLQTR